MPSELGPAGSRDPLRAIYEHEHARPRRSRLFTGAVSLLMLGAVALLVYYAYQMGLRAGAQGPAPLIKAEQQPYKVKPDEPGGMDVPNQDKLIYKEVASGGTGDTKKPTERLMPPPETPLPKPVTSAQPITQAEAAQPAQPAPVQPAAEPSPADQAAAAAPKEAAPKQVAQGGGLESPSTPATSGSSSQPSAKQAAAPAPVPAPFTAAQAPAASPAPAGEAAPAAKPATKPVASAEKTPPPAAAPSHAKGAGGWHVQLGAVRSNEEAQHEWARLQGKYPDLLGSLTLNVQRVDLGGGKGVYFRIQGGPVGERADANALCDKLKALQVGCLAVRQ